MKIAVLTNEYPPHARGGAGVIAETQVLELKARGHTVRVFVESRAFRGASMFRRLFLHVLDLGSRRILVRDILEWKPDVLITHNLTGCGFGTPKQIQKHGCRWAHILHDVQLFEPSGRIVYGERYGLLRKIWRWGWACLRRSVFGSPDVVISPTQWLLGMHQRAGFFRQGEAVVIPNPISRVGVQCIAPSHTVANATESGTLPCAPTILFVGRLDIDKGVHVLVAAWKRMSPRPKLVLVGDGELRQELEALNEADIVLRGVLSHDDVLREMEWANVIAVPSLVHENQPTVILEALALHKKIVATAVGGIPETLGNAGWIVPPGNSFVLEQALKDALEFVLSSAQEAVRREILRRHDLHTVMNAFEKQLALKAE